MDFTDQQLPPPKHWEKFEDLCLDIFRRVWADPSAQKNGRRGQAQAGTDISGRTPDGLLRGVQCKGKDVGLGKAVTVAELRREVEEAKKFKPPLAQWTMATTGPKSAPIEQLARELTEEHKNQGLFEIRVLGWEDLLSLIGDFREVMEKHYPNQAPSIHRVEAIVRDVHEQTSSISEIKTRIDALGEQLARLNALNSLPLRDSSLKVVVDEADAKLQARIDAARDLLRERQPRTALRMLEKLATDNWSAATPRAKFRILTNQGAALHEIGNFEKSAGFFLKAVEFADGDPLGEVNRAAAYLLQGDPLKAVEIASEVLRQYPDNAGAATIRILAALNDDQVRDPLDLVPTVLRDRGEVLNAASHWYRQHGDKDSSTRMLEEAFARAPEDLHIRGDLGAAFCERVLRDPRVILGKSMSAEESAHFNRGTDLLRGVWDQVRSTEVASEHVVVAANLATALRLLDHLGEAQQVIDDALRLDPNNRALVQQKVWLLFRADRMSDALAEIDRLAKHDPEVLHDLDVKMMKVQALSSMDRFDDALSVLDADLANRMKADDPTIPLNRVRMLWLAGREAEARVEAEALVAENSGDPVAFAAVSFVHAKEGDAEGARENAKRAFALLRDNHDLERLVVADVLSEVEEWDDAADSLAPIAGLDRDTPPLRRRVEALLRADRRREIIELLNLLEPSVAALPRYLRVASIAYERAGDLDNARRSMESYLELRPHDLQMRLSWLDVVEGQGDQSEVDTFLDAPINRFDAAPPEYRLGLAQVLDRHGRRAKALELAYATLRLNWNNPRAHLLYYGLFFLRNDPSDATPRAEQIGPDAGFVVEGENDGAPVRRYIIEARHQPVIAVIGEIEPTSSLAQRAIGLRPGDTLRVQDSSIGLQRRVLNVEHKYVHLFQRSLDEFNTLFPDQQGLFKVQFDADQPEASIGQMSTVLRERRERVREVVEVYRKGRTPIAMVARLAGDNAIDTWYGLMELEVPIYVCNGDQAERRQALQLLSSEPTLLLDPLTFWIAGRLGVLDALYDTFGPLGLTASAVDVLRQARDNRAMAVSHETGTIGLGDEDRITLQKQSRADRVATVELADRILLFARSSRSVIVPAIPRADFKRTYREVADYMDPAFMDSLAAVDGSGRVFLCEDRSLRQLSQEEGGQRPGVWLQVALIAAMDAGELSAADYHRITADLALAGHRFTTLSKETLEHAADRDGWSASPRFRRLAELLGGPNVELESTLRVAGAFLQDLWSSAKSAIIREKVTAPILQGLVAPRRALAGQIVNILGRLRPGLGRRHERRKRQSEYHRFISRWKNGAAGRNGPAEPNR